jgi:hypothetical protein
LPGGFRHRLLIDDVFTGMTHRDIPYVALIVIFMVTAFFAGRLSVPNRSAQAMQPAVSAEPEPASAMPTVEHVEHDLALPVEALPSTAVVGVEMVRERTKPASKPVEAKPLPTTSSAAPVAPMQIELEDDPTAVLNPYKIPKTVASTPGF